MLTTLALVLLLACSLYLSAQAYKHSEANHYTPSMVISLSAVFIAGSALGNLILSDANQDTETLKRLLNNLALFAGIPLIASALIDQAFNFQWGKAAWGRWLLALFALFELMRRTNLGVEYTQFMSVACAVAIAVFAYRAYTVQTFAHLRRKYAVFALIYMACSTLSLLVFGPFGLISNLTSATLQHFSLSAALIGLSFIYLPRPLKSS